MHKSQNGREHNKLHIKCIFLCIYIYIFLCILKIMIEPLRFMIWEKIISIYGSYLSLTMCLLLFLFLNLVEIYS